jgi:hypothetical protein
MVMAHAIGGRSDLPLPLAYFVVGAVLVILLSFAALAVLWPEPRLQGISHRLEGRGPRVRGWPLGVVGVLGLLLVIGQLFVPLLGVDPDPTRPTIAPVLVWVGLWLFVPFLSALVGNWYADLNPWRILARVYRLGRMERTHLLDRLGVWPASVLFVALTWFELISPRPGSPTMLGLVALGYTFYLVAAVSSAGLETGMVVFDLFTTQNRLFSAMSPLGRSREGHLVWRGWLRALTVLPEWRGLWFFVVVMIGTVTYDGASGAAWFGDLTRVVPATTLGETLLLMLAVAVVGLAYLGASALAARLSHSRVGTMEVAQRFAHTLVPIAFAYAFAHYFTLVLFEGQQVIAALSDPFGLGWDLFGSAGRGTSFFITTTTPVWYAQAASIVVGHVLGVVLAHDRALADFGRDAIRSQYAMLILMIALTSLGLLVLAG